MNISICADDIGQDPAIADGCLELFALGRLNQMSVLSQSPFIKDHLQQISLARQQGLQVGLHFNLTLPFNDATFFMPLGRIILLSHLGLLNTHRIQQALDSQIQQFEDLFQFRPDFIDGHQHVHQFPQIRGLLIALAQHRYQDHPTLWMRSTALPSRTEGLPQASKAYLLNVLGGNAFLKQLNQSHISHNAGFLGVYGFNAPSPNAYGSLMKKWLALAQENTLIMCHPAKCEVRNDAIGSQRPIEFAYLKSDQFLEDLQSKYCQVAKLT
jgi:predicted glycoside hydrolase/deacetylase ChbG (UPF0249 family)